MRKYFAGKHGVAGIDHLQISRDLVCICKNSLQNQMRRSADKLAAPRYSVGVYDAIYSLFFRVFKYYSVVTTEYHDGKNRSIDNNKLDCTRRI